MGHREDLLAGAKRLLYEKGYANITARDLVAASGTNLASIGYHFRSKEALLNAAMIEAIGEWGDALGQALASDPNPDLSPLEQFEATWTRVIDLFAAHRPLWIASFETFMQAERSPEVREQLAAAYERSRRELAALFQGVSGSLDERTERAVGSFYLALLSGVLSQWLIDPQRAPSGHDLAEALRAIVGRIQLAGAAGQR